MNIKFLVTLIVILFLLQGCGGKDKEREWGVFNEPVPIQELPESAGVTELSVRWKKEVGSAGSYGYARLRPAISSDGVYVANRSGLIRKLSSVDGGTIWESHLGGAIYAAVGHGENLVLAGMDDGTVVAVSAADGTRKWERKIGRQISAVPVAGSSRVVVRTADGLIIGLVSATGDRAWEVQRSVSGLKLHGDSSPIISGDTVVTGLSNGRIIANAVVNGRDFWESDISFSGGVGELEQLTDIDAPPVLSGSILYTATYQGDVVAVDIKTTSVIWRYEFSTRLPMVVTDDQVVITGSLGDILVLGKEFGNVVWEQKSFRGRGMTNPLVHGDRIMVGDAEGSIHLLDRADGKLLQSLKLDNSAITSLVERDGVILAASVDGAVISLAWEES